MLKLPANCRAGKMSVFPTNWKTVRANVNLIWKIKYRFYDDNLGQEKQVVIKGMNRYCTLGERQDATREQLENELLLIEQKGFNRITGKFAEVKAADDITPHTGFIDALDFAFKRVKTGEATITNIKSILRYVKRASDALKYSTKPVSEIRGKQIILLLEKCGEFKLSEPVVMSKKTGKTKPGMWTANTFNQYRAHLAILFKILKKLEAVDANYPLELDKEMTVRKIRQTLTKEERKLVNDTIYNKDRNFWRFLHIFFHSGSRITEMLRVKKLDVDIEGQRFKVLVKKGKQYQEQWRTIKTIVLHLWEEIVREAGANDFLFNRELAPKDAKKPIRSEQVTKRWLRHVKKPLNITADLYSLKHLNLDETAELLSVEDASKMAGHTSTVITMKHYLGGEKGRQHNRLKDVSNEF